MGGCKRAHRQLLQKSWCCTSLPHGNFLFQAPCLIIQVHSVCKAFILPFSEVLVWESAEAEQPPHHTGLESPSSAQILHSQNLFETHLFPNKSWSQFSYLSITEVSIVQHLHNTQQVPSTHLKHISSLNALLDTLMF